MSKRVQDVEELSLIAKDEPQLALAAFTKALCHRWTFVQRTIPNIEHLFDPLEHAIHHKLIPALTGREVSDLERKMLSLPVRMGGMGILNPAETANREYSASIAITGKLKELIINQEMTLKEYDQKMVNEVSKSISSLKEEALKVKAAEIKANLDDNKARLFQLAQEKGCGSWLTALPIQSMGYVLNKEEFKDSVRLRYGWPITNIPAHCVCGRKNDVDHTLTCKHGGHSIFRHDRIKHTNAEFMKQVCHDVQVEPELIPVESLDYLVGNMSERARLDISARGLFGPFQKTMFDVRVFHPNAPSYKNREISQLYLTHEKMKCKDYEQRVIQVEKASFIPLVYSTHGGMAGKATSFHKRLAKLISEKKQERYNDVMNCMRTKLCFTMLRSVLISVRGTKGKSVRRTETPLPYVSYNLIPEMRSYESY